jgi:glycosyltransferase involved in cell wall biosynthesis
LATVAASRSDADLLLAGGGPGRADVEAQVAALGLSDRVRFLGVLGDVPALLAASDLFVLTSVSEAASLTLLEAMAAALPVVVTAVGGNPEIVRDGVDGLLVPRGDAAEVARAVLDVLADPGRAEALGRMGRRHVVERFDLARTVERYFERYAAGAAAGASGA